MNVDPIATGIGGIFAGLVTGITSILAVLRRAKSDDLKTQADVQAAVGAFSVDFIKELKDRVANLEREQVVERQRCDERLRDLDEKVIEERRSSDRKIAELRHRIANVEQGFDLLLLIPDLPEGKRQVMYERARKLREGK